MQGLRIFILFLLLFQGSFGLTLNSKYPEMLSPTTQTIWAPIEQILLNQTEPESIKQEILSLATSIQKKETLIKIGKLLGKNSILADVEKIDLFEAILKKAPGNPLMKGPYQFERSYFFIPLIIKEEALQLKFYKEKQKKKKLHLMDIGSGNGRSLWLLRQLLHILDIQEYEFQVIDNNEEFLSLNQELNNDLPHSSFLNKDVTQLVSNRKKDKKPYLDAVFLRHSLHEIYSQFFHQYKNSSTSLSKTISFLKKLSLIMEEKALLSIFDGILPKESNSFIEIEFKDKQLHLAWLEFLKSPIDDFDLKSVRREGPFSNKYKVSSQAYAHFLTKAWYIFRSQTEPQNSSFEAKKDFELSQITAFSTEQKMSELLNQSGFYPIFSFKILENNFINFLQDKVTATDFYGKPFTPWQFAGYLSIKPLKGSLPNQINEKSEFERDSLGIYRQKPFVPSEEAYDGPQRNWFDSFEFRTEKRKLEMELLGGVNLTLNEIATPLFLFAEAILKQYPEEQHILFEEDLEIIKEIEKARTIFDTPIDIKEKKSAQWELLSQTEVTFFIRTLIFWKLQICSHTGPLSRFLMSTSLSEKLKDSTQGLIEAEKKLISLKKSLNYLWKKHSLSSTTHKKIFETSIGKEKNQGWLLKHADFKIDQSFKSNWFAQEEVLILDPDIFRTILQLLVFIAKDRAPIRDLNSQIKKRLQSNKSLFSKVNSILKDDEGPFVEDYFDELSFYVIEQGPQLVVKAQFSQEHFESSETDNEKILFAHKIAHHLNAKFTEHHHEGLTTLSFIFQNPHTTPVESFFTNHTTHSTRVESSL